MQFLSDVYLRCPDCNGQRYRPEILEVTIERKWGSESNFSAAAGAPRKLGSDSNYSGDLESGEKLESDPNSANSAEEGQKLESDPNFGFRRLNVAQVLELTVAEAVQVFAQDREVLRMLQPLVDVGLGYLALGQPVPTLSGGEAQRLKLAGFLAQAAKSASASRQPLARKGTLFLFDEPTTGLHFDDIAKLMRALRKLLDAGHSLILIEHNLDVIRASDWLIDLGPEGGDAGGRIVAEGTPEDLRQHPSSHTGQALRDYDQTLGLGAGTVQEAAPQLLKQELLAQTGRAQDGKNTIDIVNATEHNLQHLSVQIPRGRFNVVSGVSGSGKSTLAFDILFNEGQRRYLESLNAYARSIVQPAGRPEVDAVYGIPPTVAIEQRLSRGGRKSTVGTSTEIWHFLRLLYVKLGVQHCIHDGAAVQPQTPERIAAQLLQQFRGQHIGLLAPLVQGRKGIYTELAEWARARGYSHLRVDGEFVPTAPFPRLDRFKEHSIELPVLSLHVAPEAEDLLREGLTRALEFGKGVLHVLAPLDGLAEALEAGTSTAAVGTLQVFSTTRACPVCATSYAELDPRLFSYNSKHGWCPDCVGTGVLLSKEQRKLFDDSQRADDAKGREQTFAEPEVEDLADTVCPSCQGTRLNATARAVRLELPGAEALAGADVANARTGTSTDTSTAADTTGIAITTLARQSVRTLRRWFAGLRLQGRAAEIARDLLPEIQSRLAFLEEVGLGYLTLDRGAPTLSGGEAQRIRLAAQLGSNLQGVCYVLDEPTIGLHARDNRVLLRALQQLRDQGNTLVVVEHDEDTLRAADHLIDIGPGAGRRGGRLVAQGSVQDLAAVPASQTGRYLLHAMRHPLQPRRPVVPDPAWEGRRSSATQNATDKEAASARFIDTKAEFDAKTVQPAEWLRLYGAQLHNLQQLDVRVPLRRLVAVTGVSGSGKSTLAREVLLRNVHAWVQQRSTRAGREAMDAGRAPALVGCTGLAGFESIDRVLEVDQTPIGKTPRSCPATYIGLWDTVRKLFAETLEAKARGWGPGRFSFNTSAGRCTSCEGQGIRTIGMAFLPDVKVPCEACHGARFNPETLTVRWRGKSIGDVLRMEVDEAVEFFASMPSIAHPLQLLQDVGLGYLTLGQPSPTLSGGEAQRIKLVTELSKVRDEPGRRGQKAPHTLYVLDEPTVGLHMADVRLLINVLHRLVEHGHSVLVIEHDLDLIAEADWVIDLGPEGGAEGGRITAAGTPEAVAQRDIPTGLALAPVLARGAEGADGVDGSGGTIGAPA
ncbi:MAG: hypothetical protein H5U28_07055 [Burkholderiaceae bacterium]|nr:hypothetical protein [Burkholderiaceae bacterium]